MGQTFSWLHLSDLHWGCAEHRDRWDSIQGELIEDIRGLQKKCGGKWDAVFFTGDIANRALDNEFQEAGEWLERLRLALHKSGSKPVFLAVPGNHDLVRPQKSEVGYKHLAGKQQEEALCKIMAKNRRTGAWKTVQGAFGRFDTWLAQIMPVWNGANPLITKFEKGMLPGDFLASLDSDGLKIGIIGFNSSFLHFQPGDNKGKLTVRVRQLTELLDMYRSDWFREHHFCFVMTHHPPEWFDKQGEGDWKSDIALPGRFLLHLCGHQHETFYINWATGGSSLMDRRFVGTSLFGRQTYDVWNKGKKEKLEDRRHGYCAGVVEFAGAKASCRLFPRLAVQKGGAAWKFDRDTAQELKEEDGGTEPFFMKIGVREITGRRVRKTLPATFHSNSSVRTKVLASIKKELAKERLAPLHHSLMEKIAEEMPEQAAEEIDAAEVLASSHFLDSIGVFDLAVQECLEHIAESQSMDFVRSLSEIIGWLTLLSVNEEWIKSFLDAAEKEQEISLDIPVTTYVGVEIIKSRIDLAAVRLKPGAKGKGSDLYGENCLSCRVLPEAGWGSGANAFNVKRLIYTKLYGTDIPIPVPDDLDEQINGRLLHRQRVKNDDYLVIDVTGICLDHKVLAQLREDLPPLRQFFLGGSGEAMAFIEPERHITGALEEFYQNLFAIIGPQREETDDKN